MKHFNIEKEKCPRKTPEAGAFECCWFCCLFFLRCVQPSTRHPSLPTQAAAWIAQGMRALSSELKIRVVYGWTRTSGLRPTISIPSGTEKNYSVDNIIRDRCSYHDINVSYISVHIGKDAASSTHATAHSVYQVCSIPGTWYTAVRGTTQQQQQAYVASSEHVVRKLRASLQKHGFHGFVSQRQLHGPG